MAQSGYFGTYAPTTNIWDSGELQNINVNSAEFKELLVRMYQNLNLMNLVLNIADKGIYDTQEFLNGQLWFPDPATNSSTANSPQYRNPIRKVINVGRLLNPGPTIVPHGITCNTSTTFTRIYGIATDPVAPYSYIPLPFIDALGANIELNVDGTNVNIITTSDRSMYTICYVVLEYLLF